MEERNRIIDFFYKQLEILKSEHVEDLMKARRNKELERILKKEVIFSPVQKFIKKNESLGLSCEEIRTDLCYEMALYICASRKSDDEFFEEYEEFQKMLFDKKEEMAARIGKIIDKVNLCDVTIQELLEASEDEVLDKVTSRNRD